MKPPTCDRPEIRGWHALKGRGDAVASMTTPFAKPQGVPKQSRDTLAYLEDGMRR
jgi:hypothetical protein